MVWAIASNKIPSYSFKFLRLRLLLAYITAMASILGISAVALYIYFDSNLNRNLDRALLNLVRTAVPSLEKIGSRSIESFDRDLPWRNLFIEGKQSLEWFDSEGKAIARKGKFFPQFPLVKHVSYSQLKQGSPIIQQQDSIRSVTISVYSYDSENNLLQLKGYIRASQSTEQLEITLEELRLGLFLGGITALILIIISSIILTQQALKPTLESYERLTGFTADASHELRHPLTTINIAADILLSRSETTNTADIKKLKMVKKAVAQMKNLVEDLLFLARNDSDNLFKAEEKVVFSLSEMLQDLIEHFEPIAQTNNIQLKLNLTDNILVKANPFQLDRLFSNLLDNSIKYNRSAGSVSVSLTQLKRSARVRIEDTGIGIAPEQIPRLFERFWRADLARSRTKEGSGLGLAIVAAIVEQHDGKIQVSSELGRGTCFEIYLPLFVSS